MRSATSWFNVTLFKKNLTRFWPIWGLYLFYWVQQFPIDLILGNYINKEFARSGVLKAVLNGGMTTALIFSVLAAMAVWSYLYNHRSACLMHTLPIRREGLFLTNYLSGLTFMVGPNVVVFVLTLLAELAVGEVNVVSLLTWLAGMILLNVFFFSFATFCAMFTGHILALPAFYAILNGLVWIVMTLIEQVLAEFVFGFAGIPALEPVVKWLTPVWKLSDGLGVETVYTSSNSAYYRLTNFSDLVIYAVAGLVLAAVALAVCRRRDMERAGDVVTVKFMRPVFQYGVAFCSALALGSVFSSMFSYTLPDTLWTLLAFMLIWGAIGYFVARMLLEKSFRVFRCWKGCAVFLAVLAVLACAMEYDLFGYERWVPDREDVESVEIHVSSTMPYDSANYQSSSFDDSEVIEAVIAVHRALLEDRDEDAPWTVYDGSPEGYTVQTEGRAGLYLTYTLADGRQVSREYLSRIHVLTADLNDPTTLTAKLDALVNLPQVVDAGYGLSGKTAESVLSMTVQSSTPLKTSYAAISNSAYDKVLEAVQKDLEEGNLGRRYLLDTSERLNTCFASNLTITFTRGAVGEDRYGTDITVGLQTTARHTLAALAEEGVLLTPVRLVTEATISAMNENEKWTGVDWTEQSAEEYLTEHAWAILGGEPEEPAIEQ